MDTQIHQTTATAVRPFRVDLPDEALADLRSITISVLAMKGRHHESK